jgi:hypothetical protein
MSFKKAVKEQARLRLALGGIAGSGKTFSALKIASEMARLARESGHGPGKIAVLDTERGSASLYADKFEFDVCEMETFSPLAYVEKIKEAEDAGYDFIVIDSLTHAWTGKDGALEKVGQIVERSASGNSYTAWNKVTPMHTALIDAMLQSKAHVIATMRQKQEYVTEKDEKTGKTKIEKKGMQFIQRDQMEYEFTLVGEFDQSHALTITKTRIDGIDLNAQFEKPGEAFARKVYTWLMSGAKPRAVVAPAPAKPEPVSAALGDAFAAFLSAIASAQTQADLDAAVQLPGKPAKGAPGYSDAMSAYMARKDQIAKGVAA